MRSHVPKQLIKHDKRLLILGATVYFIQLKRGKKWEKGWGCSSVTEHLPRMCKTLGLIPSPAKTKILKKGRGQVLTLQKSLQNM
jgi:hypothetical protein